MANIFGDPQTMALLGLSQGLLAAGSPQRFPVGLGGALSQGIGGALNNASMAQQMNQRQALVDLEQQKLKQAEASFRLQQDTLRRFGLLPGSEGASGGTASPVVSNPAANQFFGAPVSGAQPQNSSFPLTPYQMAGLKLAGLPDLTSAYNASQPKITISNGVMVDEKSGKVMGAVPQTNQQGFSTITAPDPSAPGGFRVQVVEGALPAYMSQQRAGEQAKAERDLVTVPPSSPNAQPTYTSREKLIGGNVPAGMSPAAASTQAANAAQQLEISKNYGKIYGDLQNASMANPAKIAKFQRIGSLLGDFEGGKLSKLGLDIASVANSAGLKIDPKLPNKQAAEALANAAALEMRSTAEGGGMPGALSDADRDYLKNMTPNIAQSAQGRQLVIESRIKLLQRENQVADMARQYKQKHGALDESFFSQLSEWSNRNPIFGK